ncbi:Uncharacterised protein [BD1-7 clade bacterium]|uniref:PilZ domain-containing protein n=1 Tax=BD1-7 clade bacterium TaxID=2029982 RepID=A0A5S9QEP5_9GAMM|nr:Uncharacterised protein [BD1-7 clade bacterium]CAA0116941.1 Uncharacterised protein [BD1-7 clade bacterium]CAA0124943.1 Uncharacterised protein [BD1-7 clade bacterium]
MNNNNQKRQESRLDQRETIFIETQSAYRGEPGNYKMLVCESVDVSANGIRAYIDEPVPEQAIFQMCVEIHETNQRLYLAVQVRWIRDDESGQGYQVGFQIFESDDTDVQAWKLHIADCLVPE